MKNNNHILAQSIKDLPVYEPDKSVFDRLENSLFLFPVSDMPTYDPSESLWNDIETNITKLDNKSTWKRNLILLLLALLLIFAVGHQFYSGHTIPIETHSATKQIKQKTIQNVQLEPKIKDEFNNITNYNEPILIQDNSQTKQEYYNSSSEKNIAHKTKSNIPLLKGSNKKQISLINNIKPLTSITVQELFKEDNTTKLSVPYLYSPKQNDFDCSSFTGSSGYFTAGISGGFNYFLQGEEPNFTSKLKWNSIDLNLSYHINRMYYTTGIGIVFSTDYSNLEYNYLQNELVNTYENVDSMYYDPITGITEFFTVTVEVYDSIEYQKEYEVHTKYNYVQIPVSIGYKLLMRPKFSFGLTAGFTYLYLYKQSDDFPSLQIEGAQILNVSYISPERRKSLFRFDLQLDFRFKLTHKLCTTVSPSINFYSNSIYTGNSSSVPYSIGIKAGVFYNF